MASDPTFLTNPDDDLKARRLEALRAPEDPQRAKDAELAEMLGQPAGVSTAPAASAPRAHAAASASDGAEEHWNLVMKKLAPAGYKQSPDWQKQIIDRVVKKLAKKEKEGVKKSKSSYTVDGSASQPALGPPSKDLGTMIYLLGTQSSSINARSMGR